MPPKAKMPEAKFKNEAEWHSYLESLTHPQLKKVSNTLNKVLRVDYRLNTKKTQAELLADVKRLYTVNNAEKLILAVRGIDKDELPKPPEPKPRQTGKKQAEAVAGFMSGMQSKAAEVEKTKDVKPMTEEQKQKEKIKKIEKQIKEVEFEIYKENKDAFQFYSPELLRKLIDRKMVEKGYIEPEIIEPEKELSANEFLDFIEQKGAKLTKAMEKQKKEDEKFMNDKKIYDRAIAKYIKSGKISRAVTPISTKWTRPLNWTGDTPEEKKKNLIELSAKYELRKKDPEYIRIKRQDDLLKERLNKKQEKQETLAEILAKRLKK